MVNRQLFHWMCVIVLIALVIPLFAQTSSQLFEKGLLKEKGEGDLGAAIKIYERVLKDTKANSEVAAKAQLHIGLCYEKLGRAEAVKAYELVVEKYAEQKEQVAVAQARLTELKQDIGKELTRIVLNDKEWGKPGPTQLLTISRDGSMAAGVHFQSRKVSNIVLRDLRSNEARFLTEYSGGDTNSYCYAHHPVFSPDGKEIAYYCTGEGKSVLNGLMVVTLEGQTRVLITDKKDYFVPQDWMPDGSAILILKGSESEANQLGFVPREGGAFRPLVSLKGKMQQPLLTAENQSVSPDGKYVLFTDNAPEEQHDIYIVESGGGVPRPLIKHPAPERSVRWSPDGTHIVFCSPRHAESWSLWGMAVKNGAPAGEPFLIRDGMSQSFLMNWTDAGLISWEITSITDIFLMDTDPATGEPVSEPKQLDYVPTGKNYLPAWSKDGKSLAFVSYDIYGKGSINIITGDDIRKFPMKEDFLWTDGFLRWTPDGTKISYLSGDQNKSLLFCLDPASGTWERTPIAIENWDVTWPQFDRSAGGKTILLARSGSVDNGAGIVELDPETGVEKMIYHPQDESKEGRFHYLKCSPDYKQLAFRCNRKLMILDLDTGECQETDSGARCPNWSHNGDIIVGHGPRKDGHNHWLSSIPVDGGEMITYNIDKNLPQGSRIGSLGWSPDGKKLVFNVGSSSHEVVLYQDLIPKDK